MTTGWHKIAFQCSQCDKEIPVDEILMSGAGDVTLKGDCADCEGETILTMSVIWMLQHCIEMDLLNPLEEQMQAT
ncbi:MAG TPA: hypothetical protein VGP62_13240 [Bryobacteraceae bacterium]|nr:hypothetical protein [Bryobacteraceae bacterium]